MCSTTKPQVAFRISFVISQFEAKALDLFSIIMKMDVQIKILFRYEFIERLSHMAAMSIVSQDHAT